MRTIRSIYDEIRTSADPTAALESYCYKGLKDKEIQHYKSQDFSYYEGKVRQCFAKNDRLYVLHTDRLSAFDCFIGYIPFKGQILNAISDFWFHKAMTVAPNHFIEAKGNRVLKVHRTTPIRAEVIVRGYLAGSMLSSYQEGVRNFCGNQLPEKLTPYSVLPNPIITPTTKAEAFEHDVETTADELVRNEIVTEREWITITDMAHQLFLFGKNEFEKKGWILVDTKYEFGRTADGKIIVIDEIHTPDSSRIWIEQSYSERIAANHPPEMLDKQNVRRWLIDQGFNGKGPAPKVPIDQLLALGLTYLDVAEKLIGRPLTVRETDRLPVFV